MQAGQSSFEEPTFVATAPGAGIKQFESAGYVGRGCGTGMGMNLDKTSVETIDAQAFQLPSLTKMQMVVAAVVIAATGYMAYTMMVKKPASSVMGLVSSVPSQIPPIEGATTPALAQMISNAAAGGAGINSVFS